MGPTWVLYAPDEPHFGPMNLAIRVDKKDNLSRRLIDARAIGSLDSWKSDTGWVILQKEGF